MRREGTNKNANAPGPMLAFCAKKLQSSAGHSNSIAKCFCQRDES